MSELLRGLVVLVLAFSALAACAPRVKNLALAPTAAASCLPGERAYLQAGLRGAIDADVDWRGPALQCEGGARPEGRGLRVSFLAPPDAAGVRLHVVFGMAAQPGAASSHAVPTNITVIAEGQQRLYSTQGDDKCTVDSLVQQPLPASRAADREATHLYRVAARGYCIDPATGLDGSARLYINRFDFAGVARFEDNELHGPGAHS